MSFENAEEYQYPCLSYNLFLKIIVLERILVASTVHCSVIVTHGLVLNCAANKLSGVLQLVAKYLQWLWTLQIGERNMKIGLPCLQKF